MQNSALPITAAKQQRAVSARSRRALRGMMAQVAVELIRDDTGWLIKYSKKEVTEIL